MSEARYKHTLKAIRDMAHYPEKLVDEEGNPLPLEEVLGMIGAAVNVSLVSIVEVCADSNRYILEYEPFSYESGMTVKEFYESVEDTK